MKRIVVMLAIIILVSLTLSSRSISKEVTKQREGKWRIGLLQYGNHPVLDSVEKGIKERLRGLYGEGVEVQSFNGNFDNSALRHYAEKLQSGPYDVVVAISTPASLAYQGTNNGSKPFVFTFVSNPAQIGYTQQGSIKNATGLSNQTDYRGTLQLMKTINPKGKVYGYLVSSREPNAVFIKDNFMKTGKDYGIRFKVAEIVQESEVGIVAEKLATSVDGFLIGGDHHVVKASKALVRVADFHSIPVFSVDGSTLENGVVAASTIDFYKMGERTAEYVAFILSGVSSEALPLEKYDVFKIMLNRKALIQRGLTWPLEWNGSAKFISE